MTIGLATIIGRFLFLLPLVAVAGSLAAKKRVPVTSGTLPTDGGLFVGLLVGTVVIVGALTFFPALSLGPIVEHFLMQQGKMFSIVLPQDAGRPEGLRYTAPSSASSVAQAFRPATSEHTSWL